MFEYRETGEPFSYSDALRLFNYEPLTGELVWMERDDDPAFTKRFAYHRCWKINSAGTHVVNHYGKSYSRARVSWLMVTGEWPKSRVRFMNSDRDDFRWCNLFTTVEEMSFL